MLFNTEVIFFYILLLSFLIHYFRLEVVYFFDKIVTPFWESYQFDVLMVLFIVSLLLKPLAFVPFVITRKVELFVFLVLFFWLIRKWFIPKLLGNFTVQLLFYTALCIEDTAKVNGFVYFIVCFSLSLFLFFHVWPVDGSNFILILSLVFFYIKSYSKFKQYLLSPSINPCIEGISSPGELSWNTVYMGMSILAKKDTIPMWVTLYQHRLIKNVSLTFLTLICSPKEILVWGKTLPKLSLKLFLESDLLLSL